MTGTVAGGLKASQKVYELYGKDFYREMGRKGGKVKHPETRPFSKNKALASVAGAKGGRKSKRGKVNDSLRQETEQ